MVSVLYHCSDAKCVIMANEFGGDWTHYKEKVFIEYAQQYAKVMKNQSFKLIYFDGFAGSPEKRLKNVESDSVSESVAVQIIDMIQKYRPFYFYYLVEKNASNAKKLESYIKERFPDILTHVVKDDCNTKLKRMAAYLKKRPKDRKALCYLDPYGLSLEMDSLRSLSTPNFDLGVDCWILVPTGLANWQINQRNPEDYKLRRISILTGLSLDEVESTFYKMSKKETLFGSEVIKQKITAGDQILLNLYQGELRKIFNHVTDGLPLANSTGRVLFHFLLATNNKIAFDIGKSIVRRETVEFQQMMSRR